jgi:hypothetical protein
MAIREGKWKQMGEERLVTNDNGRIQVQLHARTEKLIFNSGARYLTETFGKPANARVRDGRGPEIVRDYVAAVRQRVKSPQDKWVFEQSIRTQFPDDSDEVLAIWRGEGILDP